MYDINHIYNFLFNISFHEHTISQGQHIIAMLQAFTEGEENAEHMQSVQSIADQSTLSGSED